MNESPSRSAVEGPSAGGEAAVAPVLSVLVVAWNVRELTLQCLRHVYAAGAEVPLEVVLVDNGSVDGLGDAVAAEFPQTRLIRNERNVGFAVGNNQAWAVARGRYILYLNSDALVEPGTLRTCVEELERDPAVGMVGCRLVYPDGRIQYECARRRYRLRHLMCELFYLHMFFPHDRHCAHELIGEWDHLGRRDVELISGAFMMARREVVAAVGGLPTEIFLYHEDGAFCLRVRRQGWIIRYLGDVVTTHVSGQSTGKKAGAFYLLEGEAKLALLRESEGRVAAVVARVLFGLRSAIRVVIASAGAVLPGLRRVRERYPKVFDLRRHLLHLTWSIWPGAVRPLMPGYTGGRRRDG